MRNYRFGAIWLFVTLHAATIAVCVFNPWTRSALLWLTGSYFVRMFGITSGYHRYFSHRSYKLGRLAQAMMAVLAQSSAQKGALWWAANHRIHHRHSDTESDVHSPVERGFWWSHVGWVLSNEHDKYDPNSVRDFTRFKELSWLDRWHWVPTAGYALVFAAISPTAFLWGYVVSTTVLCHSTFSINSLAHLWGSRRYATRDESRNNFWLALLTLGEGWHNNHHYSPGSCRQGHRWFEIDITYGVLKLLGLLGIARDLRAVRMPTVSASRIQTRMVDRVLSAE